jgi:hypothetical protein
VRALSRRRFLLIAGGGAAGLWLGRHTPLANADSAEAACPGLNPIVEENWCTPATTWSDGFQLGPGGVGTGTSSMDRMVVYPTASSVDLGEPVELAVASYDSAITRATLLVYRLGYYGGLGGRLVFEREHVSVAAQPTEGPDEFGLLRATGWPTVSVPADALVVSGVYVVKLVAENGPDPKREMQSAFVVRDDRRPRDILLVMPSNTWQAYNRWGGKCLYGFDSDSTPTVVGHRGVKVSFDRPYANVEFHYCWVLRCEFPLIWWLERQGYDVTYTDDGGLHSQPDQLLPAWTRAIAIAGHSEYWTAEMFDNMVAARDAGTNIASFSANTAYWRVRFEDGERTMVCFKTVEDASAGVNDFGPGQTKRATTVDPLGPDGLALTADDLPRYATTTLRDRGAPAGSPDAPNDAALHGRGRARANGGDGPENRLFGVLFVGGADQRFFPIQVPPDIAGNRLWRHTSIDGVGGTVGSDLVGWEWDAIPQASSPLYADAAAAQPDGVERVTDTPMPPEADGNMFFLQDDGRIGSLLPPPGQGPSVHSTIYRAPSGALVFAAGTMQWSWGLGPHYDHQHDSNYMQPRTDSTDARIAQVTHNLFADMGIQPATPTGVTVDSAPPASGSSLVLANSSGNETTAPPGETAPPSHQSPSIFFGHTAIVSRTGILHLRLGAAGETDVAVAVGMLELQTVRPVVHPRRHRPRRLLVADRSVQVPLGREGLVLIRLSERVLHILRHHRDVHVDARLTMAGTPSTAAAHAVIRLITRV